MAAYYRGLRGQSSCGLARCARVSERAEADSIDLSIVEYFADFLVFSAFFRRG
jgi:hypothetical protein